MFPGCRGHTQLQQRLRRSCIFPTVLSPHKYAVLKRDYRVGVRAEGFIWTVSAVNRRLILAMFHRRQRRGLAGPVAGEATALKLVGIVIGFTVRSHTPEHPHERLRRKQVHLHELFWPRSGMPSLVLGRFFLPFTLFVDVLLMMPHSTVVDHEVNGLLSLLLRCA